MFASAGELPVAWNLVDGGPPASTVAVIALLALAVPVLNLQTGMPSIKVVPDGDASRTGYD